MAGTFTCVIVYPLRYDKSASRWEEMNVEVDVEADSGYFAIEVCEQHILDGDFDATSSLPPIGKKDGGLGFNIRPYLHPGFPPILNKLPSRI